MKKIIKLAILIAVIAIFYSVFTDPQKKARLYGTIENATGVSLEKTADTAGRAAGNAADRFLRYLGDTLTDPAFYQSLERWGRDALDSLSEDDLEKLKFDLEAESDKPVSDYGTVLERYLGPAA